MPIDEALQRKIDACTTLPTLPTVALEVLELARSAETDTDKLAEVVEKDPALAARVLKTVNSSFYGRSKKVTTVNQALVVLGLQSVRTLVLGFSLVENLQHRQARGFDHVRYWRHSFHTACAAKHLAGLTGMMQSEELFVSGLLSNIGILILDEVLGADYGNYHAILESHEQLAALELTKLGSHHGEIGGYVAEQWKLPPVLVEPIRWHVEPQKADDETLRKMAAILQLAGRCADVFVDANPAPAIADVRSRVGSVIDGVSPEAADDLLSAVGDLSREIASTFDCEHCKAARYEKILRDANQALVELTLQSQQQAADLQQQAASLEAAFAEREQELHRRATTDALTSLANRAEFDRFLGEELAQATGTKQPLALVLIDIDRFKLVNDTHGHPAGDAVLRHIGKLLALNKAPEDLAARYGGEELALVLTRTDRATAAAVAEQLRRTLASRPVDCGAVQLPITASFGVAAFEPPGPLIRPELLLKAADRALYHAKQTGRNRVKVFSLPHRSAA